VKNRFQAFAFKFNLYRYTGGAVLLLRGKAAEVTGEMPAFRYPEILKYKGAPVFVGREDGSAAVTALGGGGPHLLVGEEGGRVVWYHRADLSTDSVVGPLYKFVNPVDR
jgi:hypothetical protein